MQEQHEHKLLIYFTAIFVTSLILVAPLASKFLAVGPFVISGATLVFPINFIFNDILTEVYGFQLSRRVIWIGMACQLFSAFLFFLVGIWPAPDFWQNQAAYDTILGVAPRIVLASIIAYFFSEFTNSLVLSKMKYWHQGKRGLYQSYRFIASTIAGELVDSVIFITIAFAGTLATGDMMKTILGIWIAKTLYEVILLPITTRFANYVKKVEGTDKIDFPHETNYNPFSIFFRKK
ncbi:MAG TPA: queuosine precursor transporter [Patescibacteria group bacterium]|nr:queuosine precursor transporter [Patescibacteria group bacterium]